MGDSRSHMMLDLGSLLSVLPREPPPKKDGEPNNDHGHQDPLSAAASGLQRLDRAHGVTGVPGTGATGGVITAAGGDVSANSTQLVIDENGWLDAIMSSPVNGYGTSARAFSTTTVS